MSGLIMLHVVSNPFEPHDDEKPQKLKKNLQNSRKKLKTQGENSKSRHFLKRRVPEKRPKRKPVSDSNAVQTSGLNQGHFLKHGKKVCKVTALRCYQCFSLRFLRFLLVTVHFLLHSKNHQLCNMDKTRWKIVL